MMPQRKIYELIRKRMMIATSTIIKSNSTNITKITNINSPKMTTQIRKIKSFLRKIRPLTKCKIDIEIISEFNLT